MIDLVSHVAALVDRLETAGVRAASDLRDLNPPAVYVPAPRIAYRFGKGTATLEWSLVLAVPNTGRDVALSNLSELLDAANQALAGIFVDARPVDLTALDGGAPLPAYEATFTTPIRT